jgi:hypothetical protein
MLLFESHVQLGELVPGLQQPRVHRLTPAQHVTYGSREGRVGGRVEIARLGLSTSGRDGRVLGEPCDGCDESAAGQQARGDQRSG